MAIETRIIPSKSTLVCLAGWRSVVIVYSIKKPSRRRSFWLYSNFDPSAGPPSSQLARYLKRDRKLLRLFCSPYFALDSIPLKLCMRDQVVGSPNSPGQDFLQMRLQL